jgi:1-aminocyclopropane-1-carboxylate deaminase/D-cysteine desulfhydrase-like pyridoxal-dependent ACC family enzyme
VTPLLDGPTPLQRADRLGAALGLRHLYVKRDDLTPLAGGGNKVRKLDRLIGAALDTGADVLITGGGGQSNHVRATAIAARMAGLELVAVLSGRAPTRMSGNLTVDALTGATLVWTGLSALSDLEGAIAQEAQRCQERGLRPYTMEIGGASPLGSTGYLLAADEIRQQLPGVDLVVTAAGSGGTHAGLVAGFGDHAKVLGVNVGAFPDVAPRITRLAAETAALAGRPAPTGTVRVDERFTAAGYGTELDAARDALQLAARTEGLILDPVYTGKALAALAAGVADGTVDPEQTVLFLHSGGAYGLLSERYADWAVTVR